MVLAVAVPIFSYLTGIIAALFAAWYTYGLAGFFWLFDTYHLKGGMVGIRRRPVGTVLAVATILAGAFICVTGTYVFVKESGFRSNLHVAEINVGFAVNLPGLRSRHDRQTIRLLSNTQHVISEISSGSRNLS